MTTESDYSIRQAVWPDDRHAVYAVRYRVFVEEQGVPEEIEQDSLDPTADHVLALDAGGRPIATGRVLRDGHIGRVAVLPEWRGRGLGKQIMRQLIAIADGRELEKVRLNAQVDAQGFYEGLGFKPVGKPFLEAGIRHQAMERRPDRPPRSPLNDLESVRAAFTELFAGARRGVLIYLPVVEPRIWGEARLLKVLRQRVNSERRLALRIITPPLRDWRRGCAAFLGLMERRPSAFDLRIPGTELSRDRPEYRQVFSVADSRRVLRLVDPLRFTGEWIRTGSPQARDLSQFFEELWRQSEHDPDQRTMRI